MLNKMQLNLHYNIIPRKIYPNLEFIILIAFSLLIVPILIKKLVNIFLISFSSPIIINE
jgi:hypothetical protein